VVVREGPADTGVMGSKAETPDDAGTATGEPPRGGLVKVGTVEEVV
jgi:hypothetical protein